jgi:hypothetical protein
VIDPEGRAVRILVGRVRRRIYTRFFFDVNPGHYRTAIFLAGTGRNGGTWVSDIINYRNEYRYIFEPFRRDRVSICKNFRRRQYLRPDNQDGDFLEPAKAILSGKVRSDWTDSRNKRFFSNKRLIKDIRANLLLKWIHVNFPGVPIVLLFRHPCAYANSRLKQGYGPDAFIEDFLAQDELMEDFLYPFGQAIEEMENVFEKHILQWCIEYYVPLKQFRRGEVHLAFYENFCEKPWHEIARLFSFLGKSYDEKVLLNLERPSFTSRGDSAVITGDSLTEGWRKDITVEQTRRAVEILSLFGLDKVYSEDSMPDISNAYSFLATT